MTARYALYLAPGTDHPLWAWGCRWVGRDAATGEALPQPPVPGLSAARITELTASARHYGFHATFRAPFTLRTPVGELIARTEAALVGQPPLTLPLQVGNLGPWAALVLAGDGSALTALQARLLQATEPCQAPLSPQDLDRRQQAGLTPVQAQLLQRWGYPYVLEEFRFHMTLAGPIPDDAERLRLTEALRQSFQQAGAPALPLDRVCLYHQPDRSAAFSRIRDIHLP